MKTVLSLAVVVLTLVGCNQSEPGGQPGKEFRVSGPTTSTAIKQGTTQTVELSLNRDKNFKQNVQLKADVPSGLTAKLTPTTVKASDDTKVSLEITADKKAAVGEHTITVTATPEGGTKTTVPVKVKVDPAS